MNPNQLKPYKVAEEIMLKRRMAENEATAYMNGFYFMHAISSTFGKGKYPDNPVGIFKPDAAPKAPDHPLTEEENDQKRHELIDMLCAMQDNFNEHKKEQQEHGLS